MTQTKIFYLLGLFKGWPAGTPKHQGGPLIFHIERLMAMFDEVPDQIRAASAGVLHYQEAKGRGLLIEKIASVLVGDEEWTRRLADEAWSAGFEPATRQGDKAPTRVVSNKDDLAQTLNRYRLSPLWLADRSSDLWSGPSDFGRPLDDVLETARQMADEQDLRRRAKLWTRGKERSGFER